jgi:uncharacterized membrane protein YphA (DoxX/SURF4 family)
VGAALLGLRAIVGMSAIFEAACAIFSGHSLLNLAAVSVTVAVGLALLLGFLTPVASAVLAAAGAVILVGLRSELLCILGSPMALFEFVAMSVVLVIVGPGATSIDARLFGRREVAISNEHRPNDL